MPESQVGLATLFSPLVATWYRNGGKETETLDFMAKSKIRDSRRAPWNHGVRRGIVGKLTDSRPWRRAAL